MKVLSIAVVVVACAVVATALPLAYRADITQALIQSLDREDKLALIQTISELLEQNEQEQQEADEEIYGPIPPVPPEFTELNKHLKHLEKLLCIRDEEAENQWGLSMGDLKEDKAENQEGIETQEYDKMVVEKLYKLMEYLENLPIYIETCIKDEEAENQWGLGMGDLKEDKAENQGGLIWGNDDSDQRPGIETQENDKMALENLLEMMGKADKHMDLDENQEQTDSTAPDKGALLQSLSEKLDELQVTLQSINEIVRKQSGRRGGK